MKRAIVIAILAVLLLSVLSASVPLRASINSSAASEPSVITGAQASTNGPRVNNLVFEMFLNTPAAYQAVKAGQANILDNVLDPGDVADAQSSTNLNLNTSTSFEYGAIYFNTQTWPTSDVHFRRAIEYLMNYPQLQSDVLQGNLGLATPMFLPSQLYGSYSSTNVTLYSYSIQGAINELKQVLNLTNTNGQWIVKSTGQPLSVTVISRAEFTLWQQMAQLLKTNAALANLTLNIQVVTHATAVGLVFSTHNYQMYTGGNIGLATPNWLYNAFYNYSVVGGNNNIDLFDNATINNYLQTIETSGSQAQVQQAVGDVQQALSQQIPLLPWYWAAWIIPSLNTGWSGYVFQPGFSTFTEGNHIVDWTVMNAHQTNTLSGGTFRVALISPPDSLNPVTSTFNYDYDVMNTIYDPALAIGPVNQTQITPWLVDSYTVTPFSGGTPHGEHVGSGQAITLNFVKNATFQDNTRLTASDYNFSLWYEAYGGAHGPYAGNAAYSAQSDHLPGLVDSQVSATNPYQVTVYVNDTSLWDVYNAGNVYVLPQHIWQNINSTQLKSYDPTTVGTEVGSGPFVFQNWVKGSTITLTRNLGYFKTPWWDFQVPITPSSNTFSATITQGAFPITNASVNLIIGNSSSAPVVTVSLTGGSGGIYTGTIPTSSLSNGLYEATVNGTYTAGGLQHYAIQYWGLNVGSSSTQSTSISTSTVTSSTISTVSVTGTGQTTTSIVTTSFTTTATTSSKTSTNILIALITIVIVAIGGALAWIRTRPPKKT